MRVQPLRDNILIEKEKVAERTVSGIILDIKDEQVEKGIVVEVGSDVTSVKTGDTIIFKEYNSDTIEVEGQELTFIKEENVLALA